MLLAVNGGDEPFTIEMQAQVSRLRGLRACYANNLHTPADAASAALFHPLPLGLPGDAAPHYFEAALHRALATAPAWEARDTRVRVCVRVRVRVRVSYVVGSSYPNPNPNPNPNQARDKRLLVAPMRASSRIRTAYIEA